MDAWKEYDNIAADMARKGLTGAAGDPLPNLISRQAFAIINDDLDAFAKRVRAFAYAQAMERTEPDEPDDSPNRCPDCERPTQFGGRCPACQHDVDTGNAEGRL